MHKVLARRWVAPTLFLLTVVFVVLGWNYRWQLWGLLSGETGPQTAAASSAPASETRYRGKPTSYWRQRVLAASVIPDENACQNVDYFAPPDPERPAGSHPTGLYRPLRDDPEAVPVLIEMLKDPDMRLRWYAALCLGELRADAHAAVPALVEVLADRQPVPNDFTQEMGKMQFFHSVMDNYRNETVGNRAAQSLQAIDPQAARDATVPSR